MKSLIFRPVEYEDLSTICDFPESEIELFSSFPAASYPLTIDQLKQTIKQRMASSVLSIDDRVIGYANIYDYKDGDYCFIGNVFISSEYRRKGIGEKLVRSMMKLAFDQYGFQSVRVSCFKFNEKALQLYQKIGFVEYDVETRKDPEGNDVELLYMQYDIFRFVRELKAGLFGEKAGLISDS